MLTGCVATTVAVTGTCLTVAAAEPRESGEPTAGLPSDTPLAPATPLAAMVTVAAPEEAVPGLELVVVVTGTVCPCFGGITPRLGTMRMVVPPALESEEVTVEKVRALGSAMVTARAGMRRIAVSHVAFTRVAVPGAGREDGALAGRASALDGGIGLDETVGGACCGVTCRVAEIPLAVVLLALASMSGVSLRVAIMSGVMRSTVCPFASVVIEEGGKRSTSLP